MSGEPKTDSRPVIKITTEEADVVDRAEEVLATDPAIFQRSGMVVHVLRDLAAPKFLRRPLGSPEISALARATCRERLSRGAMWLGFDQRKRDLVPKRPPGWVAEDLLARGEWTHVRPLMGVVEAPILRPDGSVLSTPGYDTATGLLYEPSGPVAPVPERPTRANALAARDTLLEVVEDFPFVNKAHRSAWLASVLVFFARHAIGGRVPVDSL